MLNIAAGRHIGLSKIKAFTSRRVLGLICITVPNFIRKRSNICRDIVI